MLEEIEVEIIVAAAVVVVVLYSSIPTPHKAVHASSYNLPRIKNINSNSKTLADKPGRIKIQEQTKQKKKKDRHRLSGVVLGLRFPLLIGNAAESSVSEPRQAPG